ncbi:NAD-dependent epimerase/dehydratase [Leptodontidium sp. 2 PMI_412]|nr:NAD-dependent epimerase/dehydratase [Leptodontidium sp. MPI-SDFR-AT-0119]KAH9203809.1 NAD-dependent epimerase/dehydratase [Leptodontidium sp. 2 PMI_412]
MAIYAVLGSTGNCGSAIIRNLLKRPKVKINAYCRNRSKLLRLVPEVEDSDKVDIFEGSIQDEELLKRCLNGCHAVFLVVTTNDNIPGCHLSQDTALSVIHVLDSLKQAKAAKMPKLVLLSSATIDDHLSAQLPWLLRQILLRSASHVYNDLKETEKLLRLQEDWLTTIYIKPGALSVDKQRGHALSFTEEGSPLSYMDLAAAMAEAVDDEEGRYDFRSVSVVNTNGKAKFPAGTPMCILAGLLSHFFPFLHPYLPATGP